MCPHAAPRASIRCGLCGTNSIGNSGGRQDGWSDLHDPGKSGRHLGQELDAYAWYEINRQVHVGAGIANRNTLMTFAIVKPNHCKARVQNRCVLLKATPSGVIGARATGGVADRSRWLSGLILNDAVRIRRTLRAPCLFGSDAIDSGAFAFSADRFANNFASDPG